MKILRIHHTTSTYVYNSLKVGYTMRHTKNFGHIKPETRDIDKFRNFYFKVVLGPHYIKAKTFFVISLHDSFYLTSLPILVENLLLEHNFETKSHYTNAYHEEIIIPDDILYKLESHLTIDDQILSLESKNCCISDKDRLTSFLEETNYKNFIYTSQFNFVKNYVGNYKLYRDSNTCEWLDMYSNILKATDVIRNKLMLIESKTVAFLQNYIASTDFDDDFRKLILTLDSKTSKKDSPEKKTNRINLIKNQPWELFNNNMMFANIQTLVIGLPDQEKEKLFIINNLTFNKKKQYILIRSLLDLRNSVSHNDPIIKFILDDTGNANYTDQSENNTIGKRFPSLNSIYSTHFLSKRIIIDFNFKLALIKKLLESEENFSEINDTLDKLKQFKINKQNSFKI